MNAVGPRARVGLVGAGWWSGRVHLPALQANPAAQVVGICDRNLERAREAARLFGVPLAVDRVDDLLAASPDCILVTTPHDAHHAAAAAALDAGVDVMVEKPMTVDPSQAWDLVARSAASGAHLHVGYPFLHSPHARTLGALFRDGRLGGPVLCTGLFATGTRDLLRGQVEHQLQPGSPFASSPSTYADPAHGGGQLHTQLTHAAALLLGVTGLRARRVMAFDDHRGLAVDQADAISVLLEDGSLASLTTTSSVHDHDQRLEEYRFFGSSGFAVLDTRRGSLLISIEGREPVQEPPLTEYDAQPTGQTSAALVATALGLAPVVVSGEVGAATVDLLCAAAASARTGSAVTIEPRGTGSTPLPDRESGRV